ncbi:MAG: sugar phosphate isomerase/epimerase family protein [Lachnospiraceae bacterium]|nr:sugar phosphate isomerase/epimerase family protein [Lachnospiraceae bacterium]
MKTELPIQLGLRLHDSENVPFAERLSNVKKQGFSCVHIALSKIGDLPSDLEALTPGYALWLKRQFSEAGLDVAVIGNYLNLANPDAGDMQGILKKYEAYARFSSLLGAGVLGTETGAPNRKYDCADREAVRSEEAYIIFRKNLKEAVSYAEKYGITLAIEPVYKHTIWCPKRARRILDDISSPNLRIIFDPVNLIDPELTESRNEVLLEAMDLLSEEIAEIHLKDYVLAENEDGSHSMKAVGCGKGCMDYTEVVRFAALKKPYIQATLENTTPEDAEDCRRYIESVERQVLA